MLSPEIVKKLESLRGADFPAVLEWAKEEIKPEDSLEETVAKLHLFSLAERESRPSFLAIDAQPPQFYEQRRRLVKEAFLQRNLEYQAFLMHLDEIAEGKFDGQEKKKIADAISTWYSGLLLNGESIIGTYAAATQIFRTRYLDHFVQNNAKPGWHFASLIGELSTTEDIKLVSALLVPRNLTTLMMFDFESNWLGRRYDDSLKASSAELKRLNSGSRKKDDPNKIRYRETELARIEANIRGYGICKERHQIASRQLVEELFDSGNDLVWRKFLLYKDSFSVVATHSHIHTPGLGAAGIVDYNPEAELAKMRELVESACTMQPARAFGFLNQYLDISWRIPKKYQEAVEQLVYSGQWEIPRFMTLFTSEILKQRNAYNRGAVIGGEEQLLIPWYDDIVLGNLSPGEARTIPRKFYSLRKQLSDAMYGKASVLPEDAVQQRYGFALASKALLDDPELAVAIASVNVDITAHQASILLNRYSRTNVIQRLKAIKDWTDRTQTTLTERLVNHLVETSDLGSSLTGLENLLSDTASFRFNVGNALQKDLEFGKFVLIKKQRSPGQRFVADETYAEFQNLEEFPSADTEEVHLNLTEMGAVQRTAYEAALFNRFVQELRDKSSRNIYVIGNIRYGKLFVVQPLEDFLDPNVRIAYYKVNSSNTKETSVPDVFPAAFVSEMSSVMPHVIIVDNAGPPQESGQSRFSKATLRYANWFAAFNDLRTGGNVAKYQKDSSLTKMHLRALRKSPDFVAMKEKLEQLVGKGERYRIVQWMPQLESHVIYGDVPAIRQPFENNGDSPLVVLANPIVYRQWVKGMNNALNGTTPNFWDDPEKYAGSRVIIGFGPHGVESRTDGRDRDKLIELVQQGIMRSIPRYMSELKK